MYEKKIKNYSRKDRPTSTDYFVHNSDQFSCGDSKELHSKSLTIKYNKIQSVDNTTKESVKSFLHFYESIPDYGDVNHLSDREFYIKLQHLKEKQQAYLRGIDEKDFNVTIVENKTARSPKKMNSKTTKTWHKYYSNQDLNLQGKKCDINSKPQHQTSVEHKRDKTYTNSYDTASYWSKFDKQDISPSPTISAVSCDSKRKNSAKIHSKPSIRINNYLMNSAEFDDITRPNIRKNKNSTIDIGTGKGNNLKTSINHHKFNTGKVKTNKLHNESKKINDTRSTFVSKAEDSSSSVTAMDSIYDGYSVDDFPKPEIFYDSDSERDDFQDNPLSQSLPNSPTLKQNKTVILREPKITIPKPFNMTLREEEERDLNLLRYQLFGDFDDDKRDSNVIKAHPVPIESQIPLFDKIMAEQENRRHHVRTQCMNELRAQMKPFKFVKRDEQHKQHRLCHSSPDLRDIEETSKYKPFKARPIPRNLFSSYVYHKMRENEYFRNLKKKIRAEEMLKASSLPPSMAARERLSKVRALSAEMLNNLSGRTRRRKHRIPDYRKSHEQLRKQLRDRWNDNVTTSPQPFTLKTAELHNRKSARFLENVRPQSTLGIPLNRNNLASVLRIQSSRQKLEKELALKKDELKKKEEARIKAHSVRRKPAWQAINYSTEEDLELRIQTRREEERIRREEFQHDMEIMLNRVNLIPTLFERQSKKKLFGIEKSLKKSRKRSGHGMKISSVPVTPDLYEEDEEDYSQNEASDKNIKMGLKVSISETPETIECPNEPEKIQEDKEAQVEDTKENHAQEEKEEDEGGNSASIQEDISAGRSTDYENEDEEDDDEGGNTYNIED
ncbi:hypothetical protein L9F63_012700 [Diploptera punctata]|uniref:Protein FAM161A n=1 Tax=Diploptera punctata TaxID=6984 RepID=A0AAD8ACH1_DIPPU|nr:hypothetical protein L9F63_012700 [Diploptera punctata]